MLECSDRYMTFLCAIRPGKSNKYPLTKPLVKLIAATSLKFVTNALSNIHNAASSASSENTVKLLHSRIARLSKLVLAYFGTCIIFPHVKIMLSLYQIYLSNFKHLPRLASGLFPSQLLHSTFNF